MKKFFTKHLLIFSSLIIIVTGCSVLQTFGNMARLQYRLASTTEVYVAGVEVKNKRSVKDFSAGEMLMLTGNLLRGTLPLNFVLNVEAKNPNDGTGGYAATDISIAEFPWRLLIDESEVVSGALKNPVYVPGKGEVKIIPLQINFDIAKTFKGRGINDLLGMVLQLAGSGTSTSNLKLKAQPSLGTPIGNIKYPEELTIVDRTFN